MPDLLHRSSRLRPLVHIALTLAALLPQFAAAQVALSPQQWASRAIQQHAVLELRMQPSPTPDDFRIAMLTLDLARDLTPDDPELTRRIAAAAWATGRSELLVEETRRLVRLDPQDTVAQLRLITATIAQQQTAESRLAAYDRFRGPAGSRIDPSVRSRLALDAALLLREMGEEEKFVETLNHAIALDATNKSAAQLALTYFSERISDPAGEFELQLNLLYADPLDPNLHHSIARQLANHGALEQASRFHQHLIRLAMLDNRFDEPLEIESLALAWPLQGAESVLDALEARLAQDRRQASERRALAIEQDLPLDDFPEPESIRLSPDKDKLRILLAEFLVRPESLRSALDDLTRSTYYAVERLVPDATRPAGMSQDEAVSLALSLLVELQLYRLWADLDRDQVNADLAELRNRLGGDAPVLLTPLDPWILLRDQKFEETIARSEELGLSGGRLAEVAAALAKIQLGRENEAADMLLHVSRDNGLTIIGAWCRAKGLAIRGPQYQLSDIGRAIDPMARAVPRFIDDMLEAPSTFMSLDISTDARTLAASDPLAVRIRLRNLAPIPLGLGSDKPINSRILVQPHRDNNIGFFAGFLYPEVLELDRRLRLNPLETLEVHAPVDLGATGFIMSLNMLNNHRLRWRALQGFRLGRLGTFQPGPLCLSDETAAIDRVMSPERSLLRGVDVDILTARIRTATPEDAPRFAELTRSLFLAWPDASTTRPDALANVLAEAMTLRLRDGKPIEQTTLLAILPNAILDRAMARFDQVAQFVIQEPNFRSQPHATLVEAMVILTRVSNPQDPILAFAETSDDPRLAELAALIRNRLEQNRPCIARANSVALIIPRALQN